MLLAPQLVVYLVVLKDCWMAVSLVLLTADYWVRQKAMMTAEMTVVSMVSSMVAKMVVQRVETMVSLKALWMVVTMVAMMVTLMAYQMAVMMAAEWVDLKDSPMVVRRVEQMALRRVYLLVAQ